MSPKTALAPRKSTSTELVLASFWSQTPPLMPTHPDEASVTDLVPEETAVSTPTPLPEAPEYRLNFDAGAEAFPLAGRMAALIGESRPLQANEAKLLSALLTLTLTDLSRGCPWDNANSNQADWLAMFLIDDLLDCLGSLGGPGLRCFRMASSGITALEAYNTLNQIFGTDPDAAENLAAVLIDLADDRAATASLVAQSLIIAAQEEPAQEAVEPEQFTYEPRRTLH